MDERKNIERGPTIAPERGYGHISDQGAQDGPSRLFMDALIRTGRTTVWAAAIAPLETKNQKRHSNPLTQLTHPAARTRGDHRENHRSRVEQRLECEQPC